MDKGRMTTEHTVWCRWCGDYTQEAIPTKHDMAQVVKSQGWKLTKKEGWVCPACIRDRG